VRPESASEKTELLLFLPSVQLVTPPLTSGSSPRRHLSNDESTTPDMADKLGIDLYGKHVYHIIRRLRELGVIVRSGHVRRVPAERGGRKASIWRTVA